MAEDGGLERKFRNGLLLQVLFEFHLEFFGHISYLKLISLAYYKIFFVIAFICLKSRRKN